MSKTVCYLKSLEPIRERSSLLLRHTKYLKHFSVHLNELDSVVSGVLELIARDYADGPDSIPPHSRWRHFDVNNTPRIAQLLKSWEAQGIAHTEQVIKLLDLFVVSVLLDAGAGKAWLYLLSDKKTKVGRSEGLALASLDWFLAGGFSSGGSCQVDALGLERITVESFASAFQVCSDNPLVGVEGRVALLNRLGRVIGSESQFFANPKNPAAPHRPGNMLYYLLGEDLKGKPVDIRSLWKVVIEGLAGIWPPSRTQLDGVSLGDVWPCQALETLYADLRSERLCDSQAQLQFDQVSDKLMPFHKLSQWLTYSLMEPIQLIPGASFTNVELLTGLAEYRNGGVFVDYKVLQIVESPETGALKRSAPYSVMEADPTDDIVVEWRALTVALLDLVAERVRQRLNMTKQQLPLMKVLEAGTWKLGREIAAKLRPLTKGPPIELVSDGTLF